MASPLMFGPNKLPECFLSFKSQKIRLESHPPLTNRLELVGWNLTQNTLLP